MKSNLRSCAPVLLVIALLDCRPRKPPQPVATPQVAAPAPVQASTSAQPTDGPTPAQLHLDDEVLGTFFDDDIPRSSGGYTYSYGGNTSNKVLPSGTAGNPQVFAAVFANDYSGVNISQGNSKFLDLTPYRKTGSLTFWVKGGPAARKFMVGLMDNQGGELKVQTKVSADSYAVVKEGEWTQCRIPLKAFIDDGVYWDAKQHREIAAKMDWKKIQDFRISINRDENKVEPGQPVIFYLDQIQLTKTAKGIEDPDAYWDAFKSSAPEQSVTDFSKWQDQWKGQHGTSADIHVAVGPAPKGAPPGVKGQALKVDFKPGDWYDAYFQTPNATGILKDWSKHYALTVWLYTDKPYQAFDFVIQDRDHEMFLTKVGAGHGWHQILIPFRSFTKFAYYQPPEAKQNNKLDLDGVFQFGIKPGGDVESTLYLADIRVTNARELAKVKAPAELPATFKGDMAKVVQPVPDLYGINVGLWAPELLDAASVKLQKPLSLGVVRYPGGLRADEEDWQKTLKAKNTDIDTDEFLDWCAKVTCKPMFTANVGDGTPESAAAWVKYVNQTRKGPKVQLWEIGNEIYGDWHKYYAKWGKDGGTAYGKAVRAYVKAMKAVDPTIKVSAVWMLGGPWNKAVFKEVADVVDAVSVHHYAQNAGSESDEGLLAVSAEADALMKSVKKQVDALGAKGKTYEIWLTEWNSVDANPGPQILQHVNALFIADYLGHLAQSPIQVANLWALYNGRDKRLGDYSLLSTNGDPQGLNVRRPSYWAFEMVSNTLTGSLLQSTTDREPLSGWMSKRADGKTSIVLVNKNFDTDYRVTLKVAGLKGEATVEVLTATDSGGLVGSEATGKTHPSTGPKSEKKALADGASIVVPKASVLTIRY
ncbi:MAG: carbohydrate binding domain-containing protein [Myxococcales bacterium]